ncbi:Fe3+/spermidine/putrescine ABC transporter ATP-binding protein [Rhodoferax koreense]|uniref:Fe3+/spermidine/putrescine ABC transporter ATP-binding protein n=1 Tax=Rhodoferax koreensis TaxID=1842727 RepID=A0A1P8JRR2_9BURK|nr:ABC transporter ATP-binding protein [Rhodoferax koreense]APW36429.1 Fe3+/spermidine/putrescine ABC transporter ATP-binding protein [Rhodoferax koreense]
MPTPAKISVRGLRVAYGANEVLKGIDLDIEPGSFMALLGASGCGKTTLLRTLSGFNPASGGSILVNGRDILAEPPERRGMAMVFQSYALWSHMDVAQNMGYGLKLRKVAPAEIRRRVAALLEMLGLAGYEDRPVTALSGGQRQRVALGRALAVEPEILLLDEPLSNLDARIRLQMRHEIRSIQRRLGLTAILVTHDREEAMVMADRVVVLDQGRIAQIGSPEDVFQRPASPYVASFMGAENIIDCEATRQGDGVSLRVPSAPAAAVRGAQMTDSANGAVQVHFRSERASLLLESPSPDGALQLPGRISQVSYLGGGYRCEVATPSGSFFIDHPSAVPHGADVTVCVPAGDLHVYPRDPQRAPAVHA